MDRANTLPEGSWLHPGAAAHRLQAHPPGCMFPLSDVALGPDGSRALTCTRFNKIAPAIDSSCSPI